MNRRSRSADCAKSPIFLQCHRATGAPMRHFLEWAIKSGIVFYGFNKHLAFTTGSQGPSMLPTFNLLGDVLLCERIAPQFGLLQKGDAVVSINPRGANKLIVKRIVGVAGETITYRRPASDFWSNVMSTTIPQGHVWLQGDNPDDSTDSRAYGPVPLALIKGRVMIKLWPLKEFGRVERTLQFKEDVDN